MPAFVADSNLKTIDPLITGAMSFDARLQVPEEAVDSARAALAEAREEGKALESTSDEPQPEATGEPAPALAALADLGRRIRWATVMVWMHPIVFVYGVRYVRGLRLVQGHPPGHTLTLAALVGVTRLWGGLFSVVLLFGL